MFQLIEREYPIMSNCSECSASGEEYNECINNECESLLCADCEKWYDGFCERCFIDEEKID